MSDSPGARVRRGLKHPVVDADGHWLELQPIFQQFLDQVAGPLVVDSYRAKVSTRMGFNWYQATPEQRARFRMPRAHWWTMPTNLNDRTAAMVPALFYDRLDELGIDFALIYPSLGFNLMRFPEEQLRRALVRAYNIMTAEMFRPYADRMTASGVCPMNTPEEALEESEYAVRTLGLKTLVINGTVPRTIEADADWQADPSKRRVYIDGLGLDSPYDYDPVWAKFLDLKVAVTNHTGSMGWPDRLTSSFVADHLGHFAQSHHLFARSLVMGGVIERFPTLNFGFLEGGVGWACGLYSDLVGHWKKRNKQAMLKALMPTNFDLVAARKLMEKYTQSDGIFDGKLDVILGQNLDVLLPDISQVELTRRDIDSDEFAHITIERPEDVYRLFSRNFYFGCEADDPITTWAFEPKTNMRMKAMLGSDVSHFDVTDATEVMEEAWEMVEHKLITEDNFREFTFSNAVSLHGGMNPEFFKGTRVEAAAAAELASLQGL